MNKEYLNSILDDNKDKFINAGIDIVEISDLEDFIEELVVEPMKNEFDITIDFNKLFNLTLKEKEEDIENVLY